MSTADFASKWEKYSFWLIVGAISTFFAEVVTASTPYPFFTISGLLFTYPFYTLSVVIFSHIALKKSPVDLPTLYISGQLMGLFEESYVTKMLWSPGWGVEPKILGISIIPFALLIFLWHPLLSLTLPILIGETTLTGSREIISSISERIIYLGKRKLFYPLFVLFALFCGINEAVNSPSRIDSLVSVIGSWGVIVLLLGVSWKHRNKRNLREMMLTKRELFVVFVLFSILYVTLTTKLYPEGLPPVDGQFGMWIAYLIFGLLIYLELRTPSYERYVQSFHFPWVSFILFGPLVAVFAYALPRSISLVVVAWATGTTIGIFVFLNALAKIVKEFLFRPLRASH
ncbi:hypothetical protein AciM339_0935 [Aciduliprofundum sp. MAR08-339]|uniref:hypothetical protein n=1 Tax=Aciduliprofundum sp. (strain MAR08-339) TaxID=673860 RepID=UPI0002A4C552|nr:hypothetical protein AciM339_0935 [Aciduliprofundum sp. MAR08-339]